MRALILTDADIAAREGAMLSRLEVGLLAQNVRVLYAEPSDDQLHIDAESLISGLSYTSGGSILTLKPRARRLVRDIDEMLGFDDPSSSSLDVVHVLGSGAWRIGLQTAAAAGSHLAVELINASDLDRIRSFENRAIRLLDDTARIAWLAPGERMLSAARETARKVPVLSSMWGAHAGDHPLRPIENDRPASIGILTSGDRTARLIAALDALKDFKPASHPSQPPLFFLDEHAVSRNHAAARHARTIGIADRLSIVPSLEHTRALTLRCDALLLPDADGRHRSIVLDAMAAGVMIIAAADPLLTDLLRDAHTAIGVSDPSPATWNRALERAFDPDSGEPQRIRENARTLVRSRRTASAQVDAVAAAYDQLCGKEPIPFDGQTG